MREIGRRELLYDEARLGDLVNEYETPLAIKQAIDTPAFVYEIRSAINYWSGHGNDHRTSDAIFKRCRLVDEGEWALDGDELVYSEDL